ncbi:MAG TPA: DNA polymerase III subunit beta [Candidatus Stackebrandtia faecavium]|nr:DNA polymerase III subunit beta [Candidatus Stackebrandtia faecavium]
MKLRIDREPFAAAVSWVAKALPARPTLPVLSGVLLSIAHDRLTISGFDYDVSGQSTIDVEADSSGEFLVPRRLLAEIVKTLPEGIVEITIEGSRAQLWCGGAQFGMPTMPVDEYPTLPGLPPVIGAVGAQEFAKAVSRTVVAAGRDETVPTLTGVRLEMADDTVSLLATDRYRMALTRIPWKAAEPGGTTALVPAKTLSLLAKHLSAGGQDLMIHATEDDGHSPAMMGFSTRDRSCTVSVLDNQFPDLRPHINASYVTEFRVGTATLREVAQRVSLVADRYSQLRIHVENGRLSVDAGNAQDAVASQAIDCHYDGEPLSLSFNHEFLVDGLSAVSAPVTVVSVDGPQRRVLLTGEAADPEDTTDYSGFKYMLVPLIRHG